MSVNIGKGTEQALKQTLRQRVAALSEQQRAILAQKLQALQDSDVSAQVEGNTKQSEKQSERKGEKQSERPTGNPQRLVAYIVSNCSQPDHQSSYQSSHQSIRATLKKKLPAYMVPSAIVSLPSLPRLANGKIDVRALPEPDMALSSASADATTEPRNPVEKRLCQIWQTVLGVQSVGIHDNFFELGGDSILSIQIVSQARESGLRLAPNQLFDQPTVAELAAAVNLTPEVAVSQETITGPVPLTPIQHWFFSQDMVAPQHWHQAMLLALPSTASSAVGMQLVKDAIATLWQHHDALRLRFIPTEVKDATDCQTTSRTGSSVRWQQMNAAADMAPIVEKVNLSGLDAEQQQRAIATHGEHLHASVNLQKGNLFRAVHFTQGIDQPSWLLISSHHLAVDAVSWQILEEDVRSLLSPLAQSSVQSASDRVRQLPKKTTSFKAWAELLAAQAQSHRSELPFWLAQLEQSQSHLPRDFSSEKSEAVLTEGTAKTITVALDPDSTSALLKTVPAAYSTQINDILLTGLAQTLLEWIEHSSGKALESICIDVEAHGREQFIEDIDISRTVGWFTTTYPICLQLQAPEQSGIAIKSVKEQLRQIPKRGIGYGLLRYLSDEPTRNRLANAHSSEVLFNYLGQRKASELNVDQQHENNAIRLIEDVDF
ncbi:MAG: condensation domain-containing protein [Cyanobacteria bacterium J06649_4]